MFGLVELLSFVMVYYCGGFFGLWLFGGLLSVYDVFVGWCNYCFYDVVVLCYLVLGLKE